MPIDNTAIIVDMLREQKEHMESIGDRVGGIETTLAGMRATNDAHFETLKARTDRHEYIIIGNGTPGIASRLDRLEQTEKKREFHFRLWWGAIVGAFVTGVGGLIFAITRGGP